VDGLGVGPRRSYEKMGFEHPVVRLDEITRCEEVEE
jgi:hypothetical protein